MRLLRVVAAVAIVVAGGLVMSVIPASDLQLLVPAALVITVGGVELIIAILR